MDVLQRAVAAELGEDEGEAYGLVPGSDLRVRITEDETPALPQ
jgi:hypothetical protein